MKIISSMGMIFEYDVTKETPKKTVFVLRWRGIVLKVTRYNCASYFMELPNGHKERVRIRKWFPSWWYRT